MIRTILAFALCSCALSFAQLQQHELPRVTKFDCPSYPSEAASVRLQGMVQLEVTTDGHQVSKVKLISGHPLIAGAAVENVRTWQFAEHNPTTFSVTYFYVFDGSYKRDKATNCSAKVELPSKVTVSLPRP